MPKGPDCIVLSDSKCFCVNTLIEDGEPGHEYEIGCRGYKSASPQRYKELEEWMEDKLKELEKLKKKCSK